MHVVLAGMKCVSSLQKEEKDSKGMEATPVPTLIIPSTCN